MIHSVINLLILKILTLSSLDSKFGCFFTCQSDQERRLAKEEKMLTKMATLVLKTGFIFVFHIFLY